MLAFLNERFLFCYSGNIEVFQFSNGFRFVRFILWRFNSKSLLNCCLTQTTMSVFNELLPKICEISKTIRKNFNDDLKVKWKSEVSRVIEQYPFVYYSNLMKHILVII